MKKNAFTLIELSIVLVIIGLIIGGSFKVLKNMQENAKITNAKDDIKAAKAAVIGYSMTTSSLPNLSTFTNNLSPMKANAHPIKYHDDTNLVTKNICSSLTTVLDVKAKQKDTSIRTIPNVAFVVISESANKTLQTTLTDNGNGTFSVYIAEPFKDFVNGSRYDDVVDWMTLSELQKSVGCENHPLRIVNNSLPSTDTNNSNLYSATIVIDGNYTSPTVNSCTFSPVTHFLYNTTSYKITNTGAEPAGTVMVTCSVTADSKPPVSKKFVITVNP